jgi:hypothetical protein
MDRSTVMMDRTSPVGAGVLPRRGSLRGKDEVGDAIGKRRVQHHLGLAAGREHGIWLALGALHLQHGTKVVAGKAGELGGGDRAGGIHGGRPLEQRVQPPRPEDGGAAIARPQG